MATWRIILNILAERPTHFQELKPFPPNWIGDNNASGSSIGGFCKYPDGQWYVWCSLFTTNMHAQLVPFDNPYGDITINYLELCTFFAQIAIFSLRMALLDHIQTFTDIIAAQGWANHGRISTASVIGPFLREIALITRQQHMHSSII